MEGTHVKTKIPHLWCSARLNLALMAMLGCICFYSLRVNLSFSVVCMVNHTAVASYAVNHTAVSNTDANFTVHGKDKNDSVDDKTVPQRRQAQCSTDDLNRSISYEDGELLWDKEEQGLVLGAIFWGYMMTNIAGGVAATHYGGKRVIGAALAVASVLTALTPMAARSSVAAVAVVRILVGVCLGTISPALHALWARWAPPAESSKLRSFCFAGCQMGYVTTFPITALLCQYGFDGGWPSVFYVMAAAVLLWCLCWMLLVTDSPVDHARISAEEKTYIVNSLKGTISMNKTHGFSTPWLKIFSSRAVWAAFIAHICFNWGEYTFLTNIPTYLREILLFDIKANGVLSAVPYICFWGIINISGYAADKIRQKQLMNTTVTRKFFNFVGSVVPAVLLIGVAYLDCSHSYVAVALLSMGVAMTGCLYGAGLYINYSDLSPRHAGVLYGISNTLATVPGFLAPIVIGLITKNQTQEEWRWVFFLSAFIFVLGCVVFGVMGSGDIQPWALEADELDMEVDKEKAVPLTATDSEPRTTAIGAQL